MGVTEDERASLTYSDAGVDIEAGERAVAMMRDSIASASRPEVLGDIGGFAGFFDATRLIQFKEPVLATSTDGVGTKVAIAQRMDKHDTVGRDLVAIVADDLVVCGAEPLYLTDYIACGKVNPAKIAQIVKDVADGCRDAGCALIGAETAEHPGLLEPDEYDLAGAATGVVEKSGILGSAKIAEGDIAIGLTSSGLHSNGYSLARKVFFELSNWDLTRYVDDLGRTLGEELLEPTTIYSLTCLALMPKFAVRAYAHITGGGLASNLQRVLPSQLDVEIDRSSWSPAPIFELIGSLGNIAMPELERALNMGIGMVAIIAPQHAAEAVRFRAHLRDRFL